MTLSQVQFIKSLIKVDELSLDERLKAENILEEYEKSFKGEKTMKIEVKIRKLFNEKRLKAVCSITIENQLAIHDMGVKEMGAGI